MVTEPNLEIDLPPLFEDWGLDRPEFLPRRRGAPHEICRVRSGGHRFAFDFRTSPRTALVNHWAATVARRESTEPTAIPVLVVPYMGKEVADAARRAGISWVDLSGNAHLHADNLLIHVEGRPNRFKKKGRPSSAFAPKSARVTRILLTDPNRWWAQADLVRESGLGRGFVSRIVRRLAAEELAEIRSDGRLRPTRAEALLDAWRAVYRFDRHDVRRLHLAARSGVELARVVEDALHPSNPDYAFTGLPAAWSYDPFVLFRLVTVYIRRPSLLETLRSVGAREEESGANLWVVLPNDAGVFHGAGNQNGLRCVSVVQTWLDLQAMPERSAEAAERIRRLWTTELGLV